MEIIMGNENNQNNNQNNQNNNQPVNEKQLLKVRREKLADLQERGKNPFEVTKYDVTNHSQEIKDNYDEFEGKEVTVAGRLMLIFSLTWLEIA